MRLCEKPEGKRLVRLIRTIRHTGALLPGDKLAMAGEKPAVYLGAIEDGDPQTDYVQMHAFVLDDGVQVVLECPSLNKQLGRLLY